MLVTIPFFALETLNLVKEGNESIKEYKGKQNGNMKTSRVYFKHLYLIVLILNNLILFNYSKMSNNLEFDKQNIEMPLKDLKLNPSQLFQM